MGTVDESYAPSLYPGKTQYSLYRRLGWTQGLCERVRKISPSPEFDPRTVQPAESRYNELAVVAHF